VCYDALPVAVIKADQTVNVPKEGSTTEKHWYLEPLTHRLTSQAVEVPCLKKFPAKYRNAQGDWVAVLPDLHRTNAPHLPEDLPAPPEIFAERPDFSKEGIYEDADMKAMENYREFPRTVMALGYSLVRQMGDKEYRGSNYISADQLFPQMQDPRTWVKSWWARIMLFLHTWGETAAIVVSLIAFYRLGSTLVQSFYTLVVFKDVHGCTKQLCWFPCPGMFLLNQYRALNRKYGKHEDNVSGIHENKVVDPLVKEDKPPIVYPQGLLQGARINLEAQAREEVPRTSVKRLAPQPAYAEWSQQKFKTEDERKNDEWSRRKDEGIPR
jgi:hypothetical protein